MRSYLEEIWRCPAELGLDTVAPDHVAPWWPQWRNPWRTASSCTRPPSNSLQVHALQTTQHAPHPEHLHRLSAKALPGSDCGPAPTSGNGGGVLSWLSRYGDLIYDRITARITVLICKNVATSGTRLTAAAVLMLPPAIFPREGGERWEGWITPLTAVSPPPRCSSPPPPAHRANPTAITSLSTAPRSPSLLPSKLAHPHPVGVVPPPKPRPRMGVNTARVITSTCIYCQ